jgi:hypothetical protein
MRMTDASPEDPQAFKSDAEYFAFTLVATANGVSCSVFSGFVGWADEAATRELREASEVHPDRMAAGWDLLGEPWLIVHTLEDLLVYLHTGGHALIEKSLAAVFFRDIVEPHECARSGELGFLATRGAKKSLLQRAPSKKHRMQILQRDGYRCRICGRRSADYVDVELHVHHIRPWGKGGLTEDENLVTLCHTCHGGLEPHHEPSLYQLLRPTGSSPLANRQRQFIDGMVRYQEMVAKGYLPRLQGPEA